MRHLLDQVQWVRPPQQARSHENLERILDAAEQVVSERGFEQATIAEIVKRANTSVGAFYSRFREKDFLLGCLHERFCKEALATTDAALDASRWHAASIADIMCETITFLVEVYRQRRGLIRAFVMRGCVDPSFADRWVPLGQHMAAELCKLLLARSDEIRHPEPELAVQMGLQVLLASLDTLTLFEYIQPIGMALDDERLAMELSRVFLSYLGIESPHDRLPKE